MPEPQPATRPVHACPCLSHAIYVINHQTFWLLKMSQIYKRYLYFIPDKFIIKTDITADTTSKSAHQYAHHAIARIDILLGAYYVV